MSHGTAIRIHPEFSRGTGRGEVDPDGQKWPGEHFAEQKILLSARKWSEEEGPGVGGAWRSVSKEGEEDGAQRGAGDS